MVVNPTNEQMEASPLLLTVAGTADAVLMIEGEAQFLPEETFLKAIEVGHEAIQVLCRGMTAFADTLQVTKKTDTLVTPPPGLEERVSELFAEQVDAFYTAPGTKKQLGKLQTTLQNEIVETLEQEDYAKMDIDSATYKLLKTRMAEYVSRTGLRNDGRAINEIRHIESETGLLPRVHGSSLFTRGETQALATTTLGDASMQQRIDTISGRLQKKFYLQYTFPPSSVGETGRVGAPGRREVGHGNLAERALVPTLPKNFPYTIRVESLITESHGSSSMASVCGGCLALMDAGVPVVTPVAGIAMGMLLLGNGTAIVLSDITGTEDALGSMDFKVAGSREGITTFQLDVKCEGLTIETMAQALEQARVGRLHILDEMEKELAKPREQVADSVPKIAVFNVSADSLGKIIGPGVGRFGQLLKTLNWSIWMFPKKDMSKYHLTTQLT